MDFDKLKETLEAFNRRCDSQGIPLLKKPQRLRLSRETFIELSNDPNVFRHTSLTPGGPETMLGIPYEIDPTLEPGTWKLE